MMLLQKYWNTHARDRAMTHAVYERLNRALMEPLRASRCCVSSPGCRTCPNNRRYLAKKP